MAQHVAETGVMPLKCFACPNPECDSFDRFGAGDLSVCERMGKGRAIRRRYCGHRFSDRRAVQQHLPRVRRPAGPAAARRVASPHATAVVAWTVRGHVQLGPPPPLAAGRRDAGHGGRPGDRGLVGPALRDPPGPRRRAGPADLGGGAGQTPNVSRVRPRSAESLNSAVMDYRS